MENTKENRLAFLRKQFSYLTGGVNKTKLINGARELNSVLSRKRKVVVITKFSEWWSELRSELWSELRSELWSELRSELWSELGSELRSELWSELRSELRSELGSEPGLELWLDLRSELGSEPGLEWYNILEYYENVWPIFIREFYPQLKVIKRNKKKIDALAKICEAGNAYIWLSKKTMYIFPFPKIKVNEQKKLHSTKTHALNFADRKTYWLHGVKFEKDLWQKVVNPKVKIKTILSLENTEQRMAALKVVGVEKLLKEAYLLNKSKRGNELYLIENVFSKPTYYLKFKDSSTGRVYIEGVRPKVGKKKDADFAQAQAWGLTKKKYAKLRIES